MRKFEPFRLAADVPAGRASGQMQASVYAGLGEHL